MADKMTNAQWCERWEEIDENMIAVIAHLVQDNKVKTSTLRMQQLSEVMLNVVQAKQARNTMLGCKCDLMKVVQVLKQGT